MSRFRKQGTLAVPVVLVVAIWTVFSLRNPEYLTTGNAYSVLTACSLMAMVGLGIALTMLMGEIDLSSAAIAGLGGVLAVKLAGIGIVPAVILLAIGMAFVGALQGYLIQRTGVPSLVFTIGSLILFAGLTYVASNNTSVSLPIEYFNASERIVEPILTVFSLFSIVMLLAAVALWWLLKYLRAGRELYALGGGRTEALAAGVPIQAKMVVVFAASAGLAALAGSLSAVAAGGAGPEGWETLLLNAVTAVLVGGVTLNGGVGNVFGVVLGAIAIQSIAAGVAIEGADTNVTQFLVAGLLFLVLAFEGVSRMLTARQKHAGLADVSDSTT